VLLFLNELKNEQREREREIVLDTIKFFFYLLVPDDCSHELRRFIEALFITHAETKLNTIGRLTHKGAWPSLSTTSFDHSNRGAWCQNLVRRSSSRTRTF
jgi:hypothetical protein